MAKPIKEPRALTGEAAEKFSTYLANAKPDPEKKRRLQNDRKIHEMMSESK
ncbi:MAG: hypothetical protein HQ478_05945 [Chloroflexi bacterium]|nr:hypothetical protein [Chloroflexota bacterium]